MHHIIVLRVALGVVVLCLATAAWFAYISSPAPSVPVVQKVIPLTGAVLFDRFCSQCHTVDGARALMQEHASSVPADPDALLHLLQHHGQANSAQDQLIVTFLRRNPKAALTQSKTPYGDAE